MTEKAERVAQLRQLLNARFAEVFGFRQSLSEETDRGCALLAASYLDAELEQLLLDSLVDDPQVAQDMVQPSRPLGSFSARIDMVYLMGLVGPKAHRDLHLIRKIRNEFGHSAEPITFGNPSIAARCREIELTYLDSSVGPRQRFTSTVLGVAAHLHIARFRAQHISPAEEQLPNEWTETEVSAFAERVIQATFGEEPDA